MTGQPRSEQNHSDLAVEALLGGLERSGHDQSVLSELTARQRQAALQAEARAVDRIRPRQ